jgi:proline iminopeptidase
MLAVGDSHQLYFEESGNKDGIPVLFVHGGPGAGCAASHRQFFDPSQYRIILFDQRGCGRSTPHADLTANSTQDLVTDIEKIRNELKIDKWLLFGGSWGSTLSLVYAQTHPQQVLGLILRGIFLCRPSEINWFYQEGANKIFPDHWQKFIQPIPENERHDLVSAHYQRLIGADDIARMASAKAWSVWEGCCSTLLPKRSVIDFFSNPHTALSLARIEAHFFKHDSFLEPNQILNNTDKLENIPGIIIQGRYDIVCPLESAWLLNQAWPDSVLEIIPDAGHAAFESGIINALILATESFAKKLNGKK